MEQASQEQYKLVYAGEIGDGQHEAVVKKRLAAVLKLDDDRMNVLFSGKAVVVKKSTDASTAARYQQVFHKAGAKLRVLPVEDAAAGEPAAASAPPRSAAEPAVAPTADPAGDAASASAPAAPDSSPAEGDLKVMPVGADVLTDAERSTPPEAEVDTSHLSVQSAVFITDDAAPEVAAPNVDHLSVAETGALLGDPLEEVHVEIDADFDLAEVGTLMGEISRDEDAPVDVDSVDFDVADPGADLDTRPKKPPPPAPDTSHIQLDDT